MDIKLFQEHPGDDLLCDLCGCVFVDPLVNSCSHVFCSRCLAVYKGRSSNVCPICDDNLDTREPDAETKIKLLSLKMICVNKCDFELKLGDLPGHIKNDCKLTPVHCPNEKFGCKSKVLRCNLENHVNSCLYRYVNCEACGYKVIYCDLFTHQKRKGCLAKKLRQDVSRSTRNCHQTITSHYQKMQGDVFALRQVQRKQFKSKTCHPKSPIPSARSDYSEGSSSGGSDFNLRPISAITSSSTATGQTCQRCNKVVRSRSNNNQACRWHIGKHREIFGKIYICENSNSHCVQQE